MNNKQGKVWGNTQSIFNKNNVEIHRIEIKKGGYCSKHKHNYKYNAFIVLSGVIEVDIWKNDYDLVDKTIVQKGEMTTVKPQEFHKFKCIKEAVVLEIYWVELKEDDIERENVGGSK